MTSTNKIPRITECEVCGLHEAKYTCPRCELRTCCLDCVKIHKKELDCSGLRDKVKFKTIKDFTNLDLLSDYRLLEEAARAVNKPVKPSPVSCYNPKNGCLPSDLYRLKCTALNRGLQLHFLPPSFTRRLENTSYLDFEAQKLYWRIEWIFVQADNCKFIDEKVLDTTTLASCIHKYIEPEHQTTHLMSFYQSAGHFGISLLLKAERDAPNRYFLLDPSSTVRENLFGKSIIEYPVIYVVLNEHTSMFDILTEEEEHNLARKQMRRTRTHAKNKHGRFNSNNFLFSEPDKEDCNEDNNLTMDGSSAVDESDMDQPDRKRFFTHQRGRGHPGHNRFNNRWNNRRRGNNMHRRRGYNSGNPNQETIR